MARPAGGLAAGLVDGKGQTGGADILCIYGDAPIGKRNTDRGGTLLALSAGQGKKESQNPGKNVIHLPYLLGKKLLTEIDEKICRKFL